MSGIFGSQTATPTRLNQVRINQSVNGMPLPVVMGTGKVQQSILWTDGFSSKNAPSGGKGFGGGKGSGQYIYSADVMAALCCGAITGGGDVWTGSSWLALTGSTEPFTISGLALSATPLNPITIDWGVSWLTTYNSSHNDVGSTTATVLVGSDAISFTKVTYSATVPLTSGQYSIDSSGNYHFSPADSGKTVQFSYSFPLNMIKQQENDLVPSGRAIQVGGTFKFHADCGVTYYNTGPTNGNALTRVNYSPTVTGTYQQTGSAPATYHFAPGDVEAEVQITYQIENDSAIAAGTPSSLNFILFCGDPGQIPWALLASNYPGATLGYPGIAYAAYGPMNLGYGGDIQQNVFEVSTADSFGGGIKDCNPVQCILQVLTNEMWGLGGGKIPFPVAVIDNGPGGTWGGGSSTARTQDGTAWSWFAANSFFISPVVDKQDTAASLMSKWLEAGQCAAFMSEGLLKLVPYGDTSTAGNGCTWTAPTEFACALDDTCFLQSKDGEDPVKISSSPWQDAYNTVQVQWENRANQYSPEITPESDQAAIDRYGSRIEDPTDWSFIKTLPAATFAASMRVKRGVYTRNTYEFALPFSYSYLEPMDVVDITTSSAWAAGLNNVNLGIVNLPVRITKIVDNPGKEGLVITAEDYPFGVNEPTLYNKDIAAGQVQQNLFADPGNSEVVLFEATNRLTGFTGNQLWFGACGGKDWGSCNVYASQDGDKYLQVGTIETAARLGVLAAAFPSGSDPDTVNTLVVNMAENSAPLEAGSTADADQGNTLCFVDGEIVSYSACTVSGQDQYTMGGYVRRGQMGSTVGAHASGSSLFMRLDDAVFKYTYDPSWQGKTIYLKFQSVNAYGNSAQALSTIAAVSFTIPGTHGGSIDASTGNLLTALPGYSAYRPLSNPLTGHDAGTSATINIAAFTMRLVGYEDLAENSGAITGLAYNTLYFIYYDEANLTDGQLVGGPQTYQATTVKETALEGISRFFVGSISTPRQGAPDTIGNGDGGSGAQTGMLSVLSMSTVAGGQYSFVSGTGAVSNPQNAVDGDATSYAAVSATYGAGGTAAFQISGPPGVSRRISSATLKIRVGCSINNVTPANDSNFQVEYSLNAGTTWNALAFSQGTYPLTTLAVVLPTGQNLSQVTVAVVVNASSGSTGGSVVAQVYEAWIEAIE